MDIEQALRDNIANLYHLSLATSKDNHPWVCEVHFAYDQELNLYFRSLSSRRHSQEIAANPVVAGNIVHQHERSEYPLGVYFEGTARLLSPGDEQEIAAAAILERLNVAPDIIEQAKDPAGPQFYKITVSTYYVFGKLDDQGVRKHELAWKR